MSETTVLSVFDLVHLVVIEDSRGRVENGQAAADVETDRSVVLIPDSVFSSEG